MTEQFEENINRLVQAVVTNPRPMDIIISFGVAFALAAVVWSSYRLCNTARSYRAQFGVMLVALVLVSTALMNLIQSNLALSLGMLGSLSIVRFRTNIQDPRDIGFVFWSMAAGLAAATQNYTIGLVGSIALGLTMLLTRKKVLLPGMLLVVRGSRVDIGLVQAVLNHQVQSSSIQAKNILADSFELVYQVQLQPEESDEMIRSLFELGGIDSVNLLAENPVAA